MWIRQNLKNLNILRKQFFFFKLSNAIKGYNMARNSLEGEVILQKAKKPKCSLWVTLKLYIEGCYVHVQSSRDFYLKCKQMHEWVTAARWNTREKIHLESTEKQNNFVKFLTALLKMHDFFKRVIAHMQFPRSALENWQILKG